MDFRAKLYENYVSKFKSKDSTNRNFEKSVYRWYEYKYFPLLNGLDLDARILDLGCGAGLMLRFLADKGFTSAKGIDISEEQVALATCRGLIAEVADIFEYLINKVNYYDAVIVLDVIEHFSKDELIILIPQIYNSLRDGGRLIIQTPNGEGLFSSQIIYGDLTHLTVFTPGSMEQLLRIFGFSDFAFYETGPVPKDLLGMLRIILWSIIKFIMNIIRFVEAGKSQVIWTENMICYSKKPLNL